MKWYIEECGKIANSKGFHKNDEAYNCIDGGREHLILAWLALVTTEVSEAVEAIRHGDMDNYAEELADIVIRVFDIAYQTDVDLEKAIVEKMAINKKRPHMHGGKKA